MGWRFRRRKKILPGVTLNMTDKSVGVTVGGKAGRVTANSSGRVTVGQSLPGTGLYRSQVVSNGGRPGSLPGQRAKRGGCGRWLLYGVIGLAVLMGCGVLASVMAPSQRETPARVVPTWTNTPVPPTETPPATETATLLPTATPVPTETPIPAPVVEERAAPVLVLPTATAEVAGEPVCEIKGNVNSDGERIYHKPGWRDYNKVVMKAEEGDTWFCSDADAQAAGFRPAQQ